ncbi:GNAT family N-acetyltransferase [Planctomycetales bacterium ZRK34]|nr:GNAT family N-acetyltransferase [Planctomycetales bacterium ZRK34]
MSTTKKPNVLIRNTTPSDFDGIVDLCRRVYTNAPPWGLDQLASHHRVFPEGQFVAVEPDTNQVLGMAASLIVAWSDYDMSTNWREFTGHGYFTNHDPEGKTLYAAEVMVDPNTQGRGIGKLIYKARRDLCRRFGLKRIRAGARLRHYSRYADQYSPEDYVKKIISREIGDPTLTFQLKQGFRVIGVVRDYLPNDPASQGHAAVIEWINHEATTRADWAKRPPEYGKPRKKHEHPPNT